MINYFFNCKSFGIVIYKENHENDTEHIPFAKKEIMFGLFKSLYELKIACKNEVENYVIAHEHGAEKGYCHFQIFIKFVNKVRQKIQPGFFMINEIKFLYMAQSCKTPNKLRNYCKKGGDYYEDFPTKTIKEILRENNLIEELMDIDDPYDILFNKNELTDKEIVNIFKNCNNVEYKKNFFGNSKNIFETYSTYIKKDTEVPEFEWKFPQHMLDYIESHKLKPDRKSMAFDKMYNWFKTYCLPEGNFRRKSLFLFSITGGLGKSYFARNLVPEINLCNSPYYVYCRGTLDAKEFANKRDTAKLVILDDINYIDKDIEIWKALTVSEPTNIRTPYHNIQWGKSLPCVLLSNNIKTLNYWLETPDLKTRCMFVGINFFIGPEGTDKEEYHNIDTLFTEDINSALKKNIFSSLFN